MQLRIFSIRDLKAEAFNTPFFQHTVGQALRAFEDLARDPQSVVSRHPEDFALFQLGVFEDSTGSFELLPAPASLGLASDFLARGQAA